MMFGREYLKESTISITECEAEYKPVVKEEYCSIVSLVPNCSANRLIDSLHAQILVVHLKTRNKSGHRVTITNLASLLAFYSANSFVEKTHFLF